MNLEEMDKKVLKKIRTGYGDAKGELVFDAVPIPGGIKHDFVADGKVLLLHGVPITKVGVQPYEDGMHHKTVDAVKGIKSDFSPVSLYHPRDLFGDMTDEKAQGLSVGWSSDGYYDEATKSRIVNFYLKVDKLQENAAGRKLLADIKGGKPTDVSIGFRVDVVDEAGEYEGQKFDKQQVAIDHDHTAVLPGAVGRYSNSQGVGIGARATPGIKQNGGASMGDEKKDSNPAADALAALAVKDKAIADAQAALDTSKKAEADAKARLEKLEAADAARIAAAKKSTVDALMKRVTPEGKSEDAEFRKTLESMDEAGLAVMDKKFGEGVRVVDNTIRVTGSPASGNDNKRASLTKKSMDHFKARYADVNKIPEALQKSAFGSC